MRFEKTQEYRQQCGIVEGEGEEVEEDINGDRCRLGVVNAQYSI